MFEKLLYIAFRILLVVNRNWTYNLSWEAANQYKQPKLRKIAKEIQELIAKQDTEEAWDEFKSHLQTDTDHKETSEDEQAEADYAQYLLDRAVIANDVNGWEQDDDYNPYAEQDEQEELRREFEFHESMNRPAYGDPLSITFPHPLMGTITYTMLDSEFDDLIWRLKHIEKFSEEQLRPFVEGLKEARRNHYDDPLGQDEDDFIDEYAEFEDE